MATHIRKTAISPLNMDELETIGITFRRKIRDQSLFSFLLADPSKELHKARKAIYSVISISLAHFTVLYHVFHEFSKQLFAEKMKFLLILLIGLQYASAYPWVMESAGISPPKAYKKRAEPSVRQPLFLSGRKNTGIGNNAPTFNAAAQRVDVTSGSGHDFHPPGTTDKRGPCPGLNAAANHGFIPRNGILTTAQGEGLRIDRLLSG